jgi:hypothetical protein
LAQIGFRAKDGLIGSFVFAVKSSRLRVFGHYWFAQFSLLEKLAESTSRRHRGHKHW